MIKVVNESRDIMELPASERAELIRDCWNNIDGSISTEKCFDYLASKGWDVSNWDEDEFNYDWDLASSDEEFEDDEDYYEDDIETRQDAARWLNSKLNEYGNTYHFPQEDKIKLDQLIDKFGSTYFWGKDEY